MASRDNHAVFNEELDYEEDEEEDYDNLNNPPISINPSQDAHVVVDDEEDDVDVDDNDVDDSTSSSTFAAGAGHLSRHHLPPPPLHRHHHHPYVSAGPGVTISLPADHGNRISGVTVAATPISFAIMEEKKPAPIDESRRLFQRLWTDEDEIELLQGFLDYTSSRGAINSSHHHDTAAFYDQVKSKFQLDFNKNQLVEKLRRLKKKYRTIMSKISSGNEYAFKSPHEQTTFEISRKIWGGGGGGFPGGSTLTAVRGAGVVVEEAGFDDEDANPADYTLPLINRTPNLNPIPSLNGFDINNFDKKTTPSSRKRSRAGPMKLEERQLAYSNVPVRKLQLSPMLHNPQNISGMDAVPVSMVSPFAASVAMPAAAAQTETVSASVGLENPPPVATEANVAGTRTETVLGSVAVETPSPVTVTVTEAKTGCAKSVVEETVKNCLSPIFKELLFTTMNMNGQMGGSRGNGQMGCSRVNGVNGLGFAFSPMPLGLNGEMLVTDEKWRKQQILELEVYSKRLELVQDQIKEQLEELKSIHS